MSQSRIADAITSAKAYLAAHPDEARYRDSVASAVSEDGLRVRVNPMTAAFWALQRAFLPGPSA